MFDIDKIVVYNVSKFLKANAYSYTLLRLDLRINMLYHKISYININCNIKYILYVA